MSRRNRVSAATRRHVSDFEAVRVQRTGVRVSIAHAADSVKLMYEGEQQ